MDTHLVIWSQPARLLRRNKRKISKKLTAVQCEVLRMVEQAIALHGNPSMAEITEAGGRHMFTSSVHKVLHRLAQKGYIELGKPGRARSIKLLQPVPPDKAA